MNRLATFRIGGFTLAALVFGVDRWLKVFVIETLGLGDPGESLYLLPFFNVTRADNYGVSLGMLTANSPEMRWVLVGFTSLIALVVAVWLLRERRGWDLAALGLVLGGALGNILDRIRYGFVIDYADLHLGEWRPFLIFNLADAAITIGVVIILARALFMREKPPAPHGDDIAPQGGEQADPPAESTHA
ncbi:MAG: signal peptidase II [Croceibacterium sp.]